MRTPIIILLFVILLAASCGEPPMPPSDEEMIRHFTTHEVAFRKVYEIMAESSEGSFHYPPLSPEEVIILDSMEQSDTSHETNDEQDIPVYGLLKPERILLDSLLSEIGCGFILVDRREWGTADSVYVSLVMPYYLLPRHRGCGNVQEFRLRSRIEKPSEYPYHRIWRPERDLPQDVQRHHALQTHQGKLVHRVRPFDITARSSYQSLFHFLSRRYIIKQIMAIARKNNRTARSSLNLHLA